MSVKEIWISLDKIGDQDCDVWDKKPPYEDGIFGAEGQEILFSMPARRFEKVFGLRLERGQCISGRFRWEPSR